MAMQEQYKGVFISYSEYKEKFEAEANGKELVSESLKEIKKKIEVELRRGGFKPIKFIRLNNYNSNFSTGRITSIAAEDCRSIWVSFDGKEEARARRSKESFGDFDKFHFFDEAIAAKLKELVSERDAFEQDYKKRFAEATKGLKFIKLEDLKQGEAQDKILNAESRCPNCKQYKLWMWANGKMLECSNCGAQFEKEGQSKGEDYPKAKAEKARGRKVVC